MKRILVLSASVGAGHLRAAQAVELAARALYPHDHVQNVDVLTLTNAPFRRLYGKAYLDLVNRAPHVLGFFYDLLDKPSRFPHGEKLLSLMQQANLKKLLDLLTGEPWDLVINTHFLPAEIISHLKNKGKVSFPHVTVTTDFETHRLWVNNPCDLYFTATQEGAFYLQSFGIPADKTRVSGIPVHPAFTKLPSREICLKKHKLAGDRPIILQLAGGFGVGPIEKVYRSLLDLTHPIELICVCGKNQAVAKQLQAIESPRRHKRHIMGFTDVMHELMSVSDLVISKPGGLTSSEALATGAPMVIINPIPGQESRNSDYLLEAGAAIKANNLATLGYKVQSLLDSPSRLLAMKDATRSIGHPRAAFAVVEQSMQLLDK